MTRRRIEASEIFSLPEAASLDTMFESYPESVEASMLDQGGDLYLRIASSKSKDAEMSEEDIKEKIKEWKTHTKEHATSAGFRKAHRGRGPMDPRRFALQLAEAARLNANRYRSPSLLRLAKKLKWVSTQERGVAARALAKMAAPLEEEARRRDQTGMPVIQKPLDQAVPPQSEFNEESQLTPGEPIDYSQDQAWRARESGRVAKEREVDSELLTMARDFLQEYKSQNSLYDEDLLDQLQDPDVFESWLLDLDSKGVNPDPGQLDEAWNDAMNEIAEESGTPLSEEFEGGNLSPVSATREKETIQEYSAPGGDWFNTVINMWENPTMDRYLRTMKDKREGRSRVSRKIEVEDEIAEAVDQCLDHFAGDMLPSEISSDHVQQFIEDEFPDIDWRKVYEAIQKISDPKKRHEEEPKERTNQEANRCFQVHFGAAGRAPERRWGASRKSAGYRDDIRSYSHSDLEDFVRLYKEKGMTAESITYKDIAGYLDIGKKLAIRLLPRVQRLFEKSRDLTSKRKSGLRRHREICACCHGTGERGDRCCGQCQGRGQIDVSVFDEDLDRKEKIAAKLGTLLLVSVDVGNRRVSSIDRQELARVIRTRVAGKGAPLVLKHSTELMKVIIDHNVPYRTASYRHTSYQR
jgi:hypothetical protein